MLDCEGNCLLGKGVGRGWCHWGRIVAGLGLGCLAGLRLKGLERGLLVRGKVEEYRWTRRDEASG